MSDDKEMGLILQQGSFKHIITPVQCTRYDLYISDALIPGDSTIYNHYQVMSNAGPQDIIYLWINSPGGSLDVANTYVQHMIRCAAPIIGIIGMDCASAATYIALNCTEWELNSMSTFLIHGFSYGTYGKASDVHDSVMFNSKLNERFVREVYDGLLSSEEITDVLRGRDILLDSEELSKRLPLYLEYAELKQEAKEMEQQLEATKLLADAIESATVKQKTPRKKKQLDTK